MNVEYPLMPDESELKKWIKMEIERRDEVMLMLKGYRKVVTCAECEKDGWCDSKTVREAGSGEML